MLKYHSCKFPLDWHGCYDSDAKYNKFITPESFAHPAKMSWNLLNRIFKHLQELNLITPDTTIIDFMAGTFRTGVMAELFGYRSMGIELEPHFIKMIEGNRAQMEKITGRKSLMQCMQGDSRQLSGLLEGKGYCGVVSPPYANPRTIGEDTEKEYEDGRDLKNNCGRGSFRGRYYGVVSPPYFDSDNRNVGTALYTETGKRRFNSGWQNGYSQNPSNIGNLKDTPLVGITSPPYADDNNRNRDEEPAGINEKGRIASARYFTKTYSNELDNIGNLPDKPMLAGIVSPPYGDAISKHQGGAGILNEIKPPEGYSSIGVSCKNARQYSADERNIGNLPDRQLVGITSPPFMESIGVDKNPEYWAQVGGIRHSNQIKYSNQKRSRGGDRTSSEAIKEREHLNMTQNIGSIPVVGNNGRDLSENYLSAMFQVYAEAYKSGISPLVLVTKNPTRNGKLRDLAGDTINILQQAGYEIFDYHRAILFKEVTQGTLDGDTFTKPKGRLSFFKRLSYDKGNVVAKWEDVIFARIPLED